MTGEGGFNYVDLSYFQTKSIQRVSIVHGFSITSFWQNKNTNEVESVNERILRFFGVLPSLFYL